MSADVLVHLEATRTELAAAQEHLLAALESPVDDERANELIAAATQRLRAAQARHAAARSGMSHLPDLIS